MKMKAGSLRCFASCDRPVIDYDYFCEIDKYLFSIKHEFNYYS
ncbi:hypothetical protein GXM_07590 [Nostoc sphaeroides CCNUC1]|uniref:Uncharacterized protein n=1 Tax=Nostoc sphaeroides CCNUC1 TaxID=2653204 RepID=A0A5P8WD70_9NOSO|nr:hypothetical protein GXM_07590 [Nostoc sphaeroides CCNUC1]